jgi:hypothetical protein
MRIGLFLTAAFLMAGCAATHSVTPREYLDEQTAATITVVADPWVLGSDRGGIAGAERDFLNLYGINVNRTGEHRQYLAVLQWWPSAEALSGEATPTLQLHAANGSISLRPVREDPRSLGIAKPVADSASYASKWWYFPVDKTVLADVAKATSLRATFVVGESVTDYSIWRDGRAELVELTDALP